jgi:hypothetical protein
MECLVPLHVFGTGASPLMQKIDGSHYDVKLTQQEYDKVRLWSEDGQPTAALLDTKDADYQVILQAIQAANVRQEQYGRPDIRRFRPGDYYVRWIKHFGILPEDFDLAKEGLDPYETDQAYWRSLWYRPATVDSVSMAGHGRQARSCSPPCRIAERP